MSATENKAVFLSYASQDVEAAKKICDALRAAGIEVWLDQSELAGGDAWDAKIRGQIGTCALFMPVISANTQARREGYFRLEWKLAAQRSHMISERSAFLLPVVIDATRDAEADVPAEFRAVQWTKLPAGETTPQFVERVNTLLAGEVGARASSPALDPTASGTPTLPQKRRARRFVPAIIGVTALIALAVWQPWNKLTPRPAAVDASAEKSVAVLAFANMSEDKDTEYFSDGISEEILNALDRIPTLRVTPRTSSFSFKGKNVPLDEIGRVLRVASVIEGSVRKAGKKVKITVKLLNAADGSRVWAEDFDREMTDIFALQSEIAAKVAQKLSGSSASAATVTGPTATAPTKNLAAYDLYLQGRALQTGPETRDTMRETIRLYEEAVKLDPGYALAWARLSQAIFRMRGVTLQAGAARAEITPDRGSINNGEARRTKTRSAAETALRLAPDLPEAHLAMSMTLLSVDRDHEAALREMNIAERLRPNDPEILAMRAQLEFARGKWGAVLTTLVMRSVELDPQNVRPIDAGSRILIDIGRFAEADQLCNRHVSLAPALTRPINRKCENYLAWTGDLRGTLTLLETVPDEGGVGMTFILELRGAVRAALGDFASAIADYERLMGSSRGGRGLFATYRMARLEARRGHAARSDEILAEALVAARQRANEFPDLAGTRENLALIHAARGEKNEALTAIAEAMRIATRDRDVSEIARSRRMKAEVLTVLGQKDAAIAELRAVHQMGYAFGYLLRVGLEWEPLRGEAKFQQLMKDAEARADAQPRPKK